MKKTLILSLLITLHFFAFSQTSYYKGEWTMESNNSNFGCLIKIDVGNDNTISGEIYWTYLIGDSTNEESIKFYQNKKGKSGIEFIAGNFKPEFNDIYWEGVSKTDPYLVVGLDKYYLKWSPDKQVIYGKTWSNGRDNGMMYAIKIKPKHAKKMIKNLKTQIGQ